MDYKGIRKSLGLNQPEFAILLGVSVGSIRNWEQGQRNPESAGLTLYRLVAEKNNDVLCSLVELACRKQYKELEEIESLKKVITKIIKEKLLCSLMEISFLSSNKQWKPEELGFRVTRI